MQRVLSTDGTPIAYERHGDGPPVVCLHGTGATRQIWSGIVRELSGVTLLVPDRRGRGESGDTLPWAFERELEDVMALADTVDENVTLFGSSYGGLLALRAAERFPVERLILYEPPMPNETVRPADDYEGVADRVTARLEAGDREGAVRLFFEDATGAKDVESWPIWPECVELAETIAREAEFVQSFVLGEPDVSVPTLLFRGAYSPGYLQRGVDVLETHLEDTQSIDVEASHAGVATASEEVAAAVRGFLG